MEEKDKMDHVRNIRDSFSASDEYHDFTCSPCTKESRNISAKKFCVDCKNYLCENCLKQHNRFPLMKSHHIVDKADGKRYTCSPHDVKPVQTCETHRGKLLDMYCESHEEVCCTACAAINHSTCKMSYLPNIIDNFADVKQTLKATFGKIEICQIETSKLKLGRIKHSEIFELEKKAIMDEVKYVRTRVEKHFDNLENKLKAAIEQEGVHFKASTDADVIELDDVTARLKRQKDSLKTLSETDNAVSLFVQTRVANKCVEESETVAKRIHSKPVKNMYFLPNRDVNRILELASIGEISGSIPACTADLIKVISIKSTNEKSLPTYSGICSLADGSILICDWQNECLLYLDDEYKIIQQTELPGQPFDICVIDSYTVAITFPKLKEIYFVSTENEVRLTNSFKTESECRGIAYANDLIYVACGGWKTTNKIACHVAIYSTSGELQSFRCDQHFSQLGHIAFSGSRLCITDNHNGLLIMDEDGNVSNIFTHKYMHNPLAVCSGHGNQLFLGGWSSHNIMILNSEAQMSKVLLSQKNGVKDIHTLFFDKARSHLVYTMRDSNKVKIYALTHKK